MHFSSQYLSKKRLSKENKVPLITLDSLGWREVNIKTSTNKTLKQVLNFKQINANI